MLVVTTRSYCNGDAEVAEPLLEQVRRSSEDVFDRVLLGKRLSSILALFFPSFLLPSPAVACERFSDQKREFHVRIFQP